MSYQRKYFLRAIKVAKLLQLIPYVRAIFLTGSVARGEATKKSDIDFFIVVKPGRIWTCRALVTIFVQFIGLRRHGDKIAGRICLNRYQTENNLEIKPHNAYHRRDYSQALALIDLNNIEQKYKEANKWIKTFKNDTYEVSSRSWLNYIRTITERIFENNLGDFLEKKLKKYQCRRILNDPRTKSSKSWQIVATDKALCFHPRKKC